MSGHNQDETAGGGLDLRSRDSNTGSVLWFGGHPSVIVERGPDTSVPSRRGGALMTGRHVNERPGDTVHEAPEGRACRRDGGGEAGFSRAAGYRLKAKSRPPSEKHKSRGSRRPAHLAGGSGACRCRCSSGTRSCGRWLSSRSCADCIQSGGGEHAVEGLQEALWALGGACRVAVALLTRPRTGLRAGAGRTHRRCPRRRGIPRPKGPWQESSSSPSPRPRHRACRARRSAGPLRRPLRHPQR